MQRLRGSRLVHFFGVGTCALREDDADTDFGDGAPPVPKIRAASSSDERVYDFVILEYCPGGSLAQLIATIANSDGDKEALWPWRERLQILADCAEGILQMHERRYCHCDLKTANVLLVWEGGRHRAKIADLGMARQQKKSLWGETKSGSVDSPATSGQMDGDQASTGSEWLTFGGTPAYMSPETIERATGPLPAASTVGVFALRSRRKSSHAHQSMKAAAQASASVSLLAAVDTFNARSQYSTNQDYLRHIAHAEEAHARAAGRKGGPPAADDGDRCTGSGRHRVQSSGACPPHSPDVYSFSILMWEVLHLESPWAGTRMITIFARVRAGERPAIAQAAAASAPAHYVALMRQLWAQDPCKRPAFDVILARLRGMMAALPEDRGGGGGDADADADAVGVDGGDALLSLQRLSSGTPTAGDYARTLGHASVVDMMMAGGGGGERTGLVTTI